MPPRALVALLESLLLPCRFCSAVVTREFIAAVAPVAAVDAVAPDAAAVVCALVLPVARLVSNLVKAELKVLSTVAEVVPDPPIVLNTWLFAD